jgi:hypothetical protein
MSFESLTASMSRHIASLKTARDRYQLYFSKNNIVDILFLQGLKGNEHCGYL